MANKSLRGALQYEQREIERKGLRYNEVELLRAGEIAHARVGHVGRLVSRNDVVPDTHAFSLSLCVEEP